MHDWIRESDDRQQVGSLRSENHAKEGGRLQEAITVPSTTDERGGWVSAMRETGAVHGKSAYDRRISGRATGNARSVLSTSEKERGWRGRAILAQQINEFPVDGTGRALPTA